MRHDWIFDVLHDLQAYASRNDLPGVARKVEDAIQELRRELDKPDSAPVTLSFQARRRIN